MSEIQIIVLLPLLSVITSFTTFQNFSLKIGDDNIIDLPLVFEKFKKSIIGEITNRELEMNKKLAEQKALNAYNLINDLSKNIPLEILCLECKFILQDIYQKDKSNSDLAIDKAIEYVETLRAKTKDDKILFRKLLASEIVKINSTYGAQMLKKP